MAKTTKQTKADMAREAKLASLASSLQAKFDEYSSERSAKESEWRRSVDQYDGKVDTVDTDKLLAAMEVDSKGDCLTVNITRPKTNIAIAKMQDIQFPLGGDFNFTMKPTPVPTGSLLKEESPDTPSPNTIPNQQVLDAMSASAPGMPKAPTREEVAKEVIDKAIEASRLMTAHIRDNLVEIDYGKKARRAIADMCILGTGIVKGPTISKRPIETYMFDGKEYHFGTEYALTPDVERVDPRLFYPNPSAREPSEIEDCFELRIVTRSDLIGMAKNPAFMGDQIKALLMCDPQKEEIPTILQQTANYSTGKGRAPILIKEYHGLLDKHVLAAEELISEEEAEDPLTEYFGEVWFCGGKVIRLAINPIDGFVGIPYGLATWEADPESVFGHGVPHLLRHPSRVVNSAYAILLDNAALTSGPQIIINSQVIEPAGKGNDYRIRPMKSWHITDYGVDPASAISFINIPAQMDGMSAIIDMAMQFADIESAIPLSAAGEMQAANNTTGMAMIFSASSVVQKAASTSWDDNITRPLIRRLYHFNMQYSDNNDIKGDQSVEIGGATERIEAQLRAQEIERLLGLAQTSPEFQMQIDPVRAFRSLVANTRAGDILRPASIVQQELDQKRAQQEQQAAAQDPAAIRAQAEMIKAQTAAQVAQGSAQLQQAEIQLKREAMQQKAAIAQADIESRNHATMAQLQAQEADRELLMIELASKQNISVAEMENTMRIEGSKIAIAREKLMADLARHASEIEYAKESGQGI